VVVEGVWSEGVLGIVVFAEVGTGWVGMKRGVWKGGEGESR
jgi:hypothetical protein